MATHTANTKPDDGEREGELPAYVVDSLLASRVRRQLLRRLRDAAEPVPVDDLAAAIAGSAGGGGSDATEAEIPTDRRRARTDIYQRHLPRLTETGAVAFDSRLGTVEFTGGPRLTERLDDPS